MGKKTMNVKNRTIFSNDNLLILRGLDTESVDLIYLDPPFNSNRNYAAPIGSEAAGAAFIVKSENKFTVLPIVEETG